MIAVTGGAGFIGSAFVWALNEKGESDILVVDEKNIADRAANLKSRQYQDTMDKDRFLQAVREGALDGKLSAVVHMGACSSTTVTDADYVRKNNFEYTRDLALFCMHAKIPFLYASSAATYGDGGFGYSDADENTRRLKPLNLYGRSKQDFDLWALETGALGKITGFKFFNVYGPNEYHKGDMKSVIAKSYGGVARARVMRLFKSCKPGYGHGEQKRDFVYIKDAVAAVMYFLEHPDRTGLFNVGTGEARSWNDLARALFSALQIPLNIEYIEMPENIAVILKRNSVYRERRKLHEILRSHHGRRVRIPPFGPWQ
jgi:ADP-L-glycero-D-manno-heptose 6-epimerase